MHREGISTPHARHKGRQPLIKCAISCLQFILFSPFLRFYVFSLFYVFLAFYGPFVFFYLFVVDKGVTLDPMYSSIAMMKLDLRSSFRTKRWMIY